MLLLIRSLTLLVFTTWITCSISSQVTFTEQPEVRSLMEYYISQGQGNDIIDGWRIKIISTTDRRALESAKYKFESSYPGYNYQQDYEAPYYSLKIGAYEDRFDVEPMLVKVKHEFKGAIPFRDRIAKRELFTRDGE